MGRILQIVTLTNAGDLSKYRDGTLPEEQVRHTEVEMLVDTGAAMLCLPPEYISKLGLRETGRRRAITANGQVDRSVYEPVRIAVSDRSAILEVMELPAGTPPLLGYLPLEALDLYPNPQRQVLEGNPQYDGKMVVDLL
jgi:predicted aspartyl protease